MRFHHSGVSWAEPIVILLVETLPLLNVIGNLSWGRGKVHFYFLSLRKTRKLKPTGTRLVFRQRQRSSRSI